LPWDLLNDNVLGVVLVLVVVAIAGGAIFGHSLFAHYMLHAADAARGTGAALSRHRPKSARPRPTRRGRADFHFRNAAAYVLGGGFAPLAACLQGGMRLGDALATMPGLLPPANLGYAPTGQKFGDLKKVLPAVRQMLKDAVSQRAERPTTSS